MQIKYNFNFDQIIDNYVVILVCKSLDDEFMSMIKAERGENNSGSTMVLSLIQNGRFTIANIGDSSAMLLK
jgi:serine/threonine protein phosphatase PrpC|tara:strand:+ start:153 stop:365 length:213 start_codon:yes stop_codon:yes gene_type:complete